ncbi:hypothetical protein [Plantactinospora sonchi]|uniref:Uncharacterized protein n=1 Tax=Plantactinospora sonchi TaxID=1544735 RepID=A0ABU7RPD0_9ACTN
MSVPANPTTPAPQARPVTVTISTYLLYLTALMFVVIAVAGLATIGPTTDILDELYAGTELEGASGLTTGILVGSGVVNILVGIGLVVLAVLNNGGRNVSRIITWVIGGLGILCCLVPGLGGAALGGTLSGIGGSSGDVNVPDPQEVQRRLEDAVPGWTTPVSLAATVIGLLALLAAVILLALPASNAYFRRPAAAGWEPPLPGTPYPGQQPPYPGQPYPGQPYPGQQPPYPGQEPPYPGQSHPGQQPPQPGGQQPGQQPPNNPPSS